MNRLKVGLLGLAGAGAEYLKSLLSNDRFEVAAVAESDLEVLRRYGDTSGWRCYEDYRSVIVEAPRLGLDLVFVALQPFQSLELMELAAARGIGVFHKAPWARNFREAQSIAQRFDGGHCPFVVPRPWQCGSNLPLFRGLGAQLGHVHLAHAEVSTDSAPLGWRGDSIRAGGGVLLNDAYTHLDFLVQLLGVPDRVYARCCDAAGPGTVRNYDTEDVAVVTLSFGGERIGTLSVWRTHDHPQWRILVAGRDGTAVVTEQEVRVAQSEGARSRELMDWSLECTVEAFGASHGEDAHNSVASVGDHLPTMAVIEAAYLSEKTGAPEAPAQFLASFTPGQ